MGVFLNSLSPLTVSSPADPTGTTDTTGKMMGLAVAITPNFTGRVRVSIYGNVTNSTAAAGDGGKTQIRYGTGSAPANGAALTGTTLGPQITSVLERATANDLQAFAHYDVITGLTLNTAIWVDIGLAAVVGGTAVIKNLRVVLEEF